jgi:ribosomal protein S18 acetylase RimI-like enzyme
VATPQIDLATPGDVDRLAALDVKDTAWPAWLNDPAVVVVCARAGSEMAGAAAGKIADDGTAEIIAAQVVPAWRRQYLGSELLDHLANVLRERGAKLVQATVKSQDDLGIGFFASQGWQQRVHVYSRALLPEEAKPKGWRSVVRGWLRRLKRNSID